MFLDMLQLYGSGGSYDALYTVVGYNNTFSHGAEQLDKIMDFREQIEDSHKQKIRHEMD